MTLDHRDHELAQPRGRVRRGVVGVLGEIVDHQRPAAEAGDHVAVDVASALRAVDIADTHQHPVEMVALSPDGRADLRGDVLLERGRDLHVRRPDLDVHDRTLGCFGARVRSH